MQVVVEVFNSKGEYREAILSPWIVEQPAQECETEVTCPPEPEPEEEAAPEDDEGFTESDDVGRRL